MRRPHDALRSLRRYVAECLEDYEVRGAEEQGTFERPFALVSRVGPGTVAGRQISTHYMLPTNVQLYPPAGDDEEDGMYQAEAAEELLFQAFRVGVGLGRPARVPLYDYDGVGPDEGAVKRHPSDYLRVTSMTVSQTRDPDDGRLWTVTADMRLGWVRRGRVPSGDPVSDVAVDTYDVQVST